MTSSTTEHEIGPISLFVIRFETIDRFRGEIIREMGRVRNRGVIRLIDGLFVSKAEDGDLTVLRDTDLAGDDDSPMGAAILAMLGYSPEEGAHVEPPSLDLGHGIEVGFGADIAEVVAADVETGKAALLLLIEHRWAIDLDRAIRDAGGQTVLRGSLSAELTLALGAELEAIVNAAETVEAAEAIAGDAILEALAAVDATHAIAESAIEKANAIVDGAAAAGAAGRAAVAADTVRTLIAAGLLDGASAVEALDFLVDAGIVTADAAASAAGQAAATVAERSSPKESEGE